MSSFAALDKPLVVGIKANSSVKIPEGKLSLSTVDYLYKRGIKPVYPYDGTRGNNAVDVVAEIEVTSNYSGSGWNFLINFPGFLLFAPAWNGYVYNADYNFKFRLLKPGDNSLIEKWDVPVNLNIRHADISRTWTEVSWFEFGVIAFIGGVCFIQYDDDVTPLVINQTRETLGQYLGSQLVQHIQQAQISPTVDTGRHSDPDDKPVDVSKYPYLDTTAAVLTFDARAGVSAEQVAILADRFEVEYGQKNVQKLVSRSKMKEVLELQKFSAVCSSTECAVEAGQLLGVEYMIYGSIGCIGSVYTINVYMTNVEKGNMVASAAVDYEGKIDGLLTEGMRKAANALIRSVIEKKRP